MAIVASFPFSETYGYRRITVLLQSAGWQVGRIECSGSGDAKG